MFWKCVFGNLDYTNLHHVGGRIAQIFEYKITILLRFFFKQLWSVTTNIKTSNEFLLRSVKTSWMITVCFNHVFLWTLHPHNGNSIWYFTKEKEHISLQIQRCVLTHSDIIVSFKQKHNHSLVFCQVGCAGCQ